MNDRKVNLCRAVILAAFLAVLLVFAYKVPDMPVGQQEEPEKPQLTIWVDAGNELPVRMALYAYVSGRLEDTGEYGAYYPDFTWNLQDKSYLTQGQLQQELAAALKEGRGPDLILMDEANGIDLQLLMENGALLELEESVTQEYLGYSDLDYLDGTLEQGQMNGKQYILPIYVQCPVVFGPRDALKDAGIDPEGDYGTLEEFLEGMLAAAEACGRKIFEDASAADWLEQYAMPKGAEQDTERLQGLLDRVREESGTEDSFFGPYESMEAGECLLSGCGFDQKSKMSQNAALLGTDQAAFLAVPAWDGEVRAVVAQAAAVNADTAYPEEACALLRFFQSILIQQPTVHQTYPALGIDGYWKKQLESQTDKIDEAVYPEYAAQAERIAAASPAGRRFLACARDAVTDAVYRAAAPDMDTGIDADAAQKEVLTVGFGDQGMGREYPLYQWLSDAAERYSNSRLHIQLVPMPYYNLTFIVYQEQMEQAGAGMDIFLDTSLALENSGIPADLTPYLETCGEKLQTMEISGRQEGLLYGIEEMEGSQDRQYGFVISDKSAMKEEAFGFCAAALKEKGYVKAVRAAGCEPVNME